MASSALVTTNIQSGPTGSLAEITATLTQIQNATALNAAAFSRSLLTHENRGMEAHGVFYDGTRYLSSGLVYLGRSVGFPTTAGILYVPTSLSPTQVTG